MKGGKTKENRRKKNKQNNKAKAPIKERSVCRFDDWR